MASLHGDASVGVAVVRVTVVGVAVVDFVVKLRCV